MAVTMLTAATLFCGHCLCQAGWTGEPYGGQAPGLPWRWGGDVSPGHACRESLRMRRGDTGQAQPFPLTGTRCHQPCPEGFWKPTVATPAPARTGAPRPQEQLRLCTSSEAPSARNVRLPPSPCLSVQCQMPEAPTLPLLVCSADSSLWAGCTQWEGGRERGWSQG